jgi:hypothetical protein
VSICLGCSTGLATSACDSSADAGSAAAAAAAAAACSPENSAASGATAVGLPSRDSRAGAALHGTLNVIATYRVHYLLFNELCVNNMGKWCIEPPSLHQPACRAAATCNVIQKWDVGRV